MPLAACHDVSQPACSRPDRGENWHKNRAGVRGSESSRSKVTSAGARARNCNRTFNSFGCLLSCDSCCSSKQIGEFQACRDFGDFVIRACVGALQCGLCRVGVRGWGSSEGGRYPRQASPPLLSAFPVLQPANWPHWPPSSVSRCRPVPCPMAPSVPEQPGRGPRRTESAVPLALGSADAVRGQPGGRALFSRFLLQKESLQGVRGRLLAAKVLTNSR